MNERAVKTLWHLSIALLAMIEAQSCDRWTAAGKARYLFLGGVVGWHTAGAAMDWWDADSRTSLGVPNDRG